MRSFHCWKEVSEPLNLWLAWRDLERGKRRRPDVAAFAIDADRHVHRLARELGDGSYRPGPYRLLHISDPKRRIVAAAPVADRLVHHAVHRVLAPHWNRGFINHSYACLPGRGGHRALLRFRESLRRWRHVLQLDVRRYFYSIDRPVLRGLLFRRLSEPPLRALLDRILESGHDLYRRPEVIAWLGWDGPATFGRGLPIGNLTSQWWGNLYLDGLDHHAQRRLRVPGYQRYMDDISCFGDNRAELEELRERIAAWLRRERHLELKHPDARPQRCDRWHTYLGYRVSRRGFSIGPKALGRLPGLLGAHVDERPCVTAAIRAVGAVWMFG